MFLRNAGLRVMCSLVFFLCAVLAGCSRHDDHVLLVWKNGRAVAIAIHDGLFKNRSATDVKDSLKVVVAGRENDKGILGSFVPDWHGIDFEPLIPLSPGMSYDILLSGKRIARVKVPAASGRPPKLLAVYPETDTVPENLLKFYFQFDQPMRTGQVLNHIFLLDKNGDTLQCVFLDLQPELWDTTSKVLTLWLDPGRIKRSLLLNRQLGNPLKANKAYQLVVSHTWKDTRGISLAQDYIKHFMVGDRDGTMPDINKWRLDVPKAETKDALKINTLEPLDHFLLQESINVLDEKGKLVDGYNNIDSKRQLWIFTPGATWPAGHYRIQVKARLEDLAGNNLNRVFDRDITKDKQQDRDLYEREFEIR